MTGGLIGCYKVPDENKVVLGCALGANEFSYEWNLDTDDITQLHTCKNQRGVKFHIKSDDRTVFASAHSRNVWTFTVENGLKKYTGAQVFETSHSPPMSLLSPIKAGACMCATGYTGFTCEECLSGYYLTTADDICNGKNTFVLEM